MILFSVEWYHANALQVMQEWENGMKEGKKDTFL